MPKRVRQVASALAMAGALASGAGCEAVGGSTAVDREAESVAAKIKRVGDFCIGSPSDVDEITCKIKFNGQETGQWTTDCWDVKKSGTVPVGLDLLKALEGSDTLSDPLVSYPANPNPNADCKIKGTY